MKKQTFAAAFISALLITVVAGTLFINSAAANFGPVQPSNPNLSVFSPMPNEAYNTTSISLQFMVREGVFGHLGSD